MQSQDVWNNRIIGAADRLGLKAGYKLLYVPWRTLGQADTVFLSLNPGRAPRDLHMLCALTDERGNSYEVERATTGSAINEQFLELVSRLGLRPVEVLTGVIAPFRTGRWEHLDPAHRREALDIGRDFWTQAFAVKRPRLVIGCGELAGREAAQMLNAKLEGAIPSGWDRIVLRRYLAPDGAAVVQLPHLSTFKLLSREQCREPLRRAFDLSTALI